MLWKYLDLFINGEEYFLKNGLMFCCNKQCFRKLQLFIPMRHFSLVTYQRNALSHRIPPANLQENRYPLSTDVTNLTNIPIMQVSSKSRANFRCSGQAWDIWIFQLTLVDTDALMHRLYIGRNGANKYKGA